MRRKEGRKERKKEGRKEGRKGGSEGGRLIPSSILFMVSLIPPENP